jgi:hypothetical protein
MVVLSSFQNHHNNDTTMATTQPLESTAITAFTAEITALSAEIKAEKAELKDLYDVNKEDRDTDRINALGDSIATLVDERKDLRLALIHAPQPTQGKFTDCQRVVISLCHYVDRFPNSDVVSLSKCVLSVELALARRRTFLPKLHHSTSSCQHILSTYRYVTTSTSFPNSDHCLSLLGVP